MRLLTHNSLRCHAKDVTKGWPLQLKIEDMEISETDFSPEFIKSILPGLDWEGVKLAASAIEFDGVPETWNNELLKDEDFLRAMQKLLLDVHIQEGVLICPESSREFKIQNGVPNMM